MPLETFSVDMHFKAFIAYMPFKAYTADMKSLWLRTPAQLSDQMRSLRRARGLTQAALGKLAGLDQTRIAKIERDPRRVSVGQLLALLAALQVRVILQPTPDSTSGAVAPAGRKPPDW